MQSDAMKVMFVRMNIRLQKIHKIFFPQTENKFFSQMCFLSLKYMHVKMRESIKKKGRRGKPKPNTITQFPNVHTGFGWTYLFNINKHHFILVLIAEYKCYG